MQCYALFYVLCLYTHARIFAKTFWICLKYKYIQTCLYYIYILYILRTSVDVHPFPLLCGHVVPVRLALPIPTFQNQRRRNAKPFSHLLRTPQIQSTCWIDLNCTLSSPIQLVFQPWCLENLRLSLALIGCKTVAIWIPSRVSWCSCFLWQSWGKPTPFKQLKKLDFERR